ncbi:MAG: hypothetical protein AB1553_01760 [Nitrospirota bacterium]
MGSYATKAFFKKKLQEFIEDEYKYFEVAPAVDCCPKCEKKANKKIAIATATKDDYPPFHRKCTCSILPLDDDQEADSLNRIRAQYASGEFPMKRCPHCSEWMAGNAQQCTKCGGFIIPVSKGGFMDEFEKIKRDALHSVQEVESKAPPAEQSFLDQLGDTPPPVKESPTSFNFKRVGKAIGILICLAVVLSLLGAYLKGTSYYNPPAQPQYKPSKFDAFVMCQQFVEKKLKAPSTADFASSTESTLTAIDRNTFMIISYVDAQNSFGAKLRNHYACKVQHVDDKNWKLLDLAINN